eukprot:COSAG06_NODE_21168_length_767_cov_1.022455_1_plen_34_part_10
MRGLFGVMSAGNTPRNRCFGKYRLPYACNSDVLV